MRGEQTGPMLRLAAIFLALAGVVAYLVLSESKPSSPPATPAPSPAATPPAAAPGSECAIALPEGAGRLVLMTKPSADKPGAQLRQIRIETPAPGETATLPAFPDAAWRMNVYWYPREAERGPFVRLQDREGEYLLTLGHKTLARMLRIKGETHVGVFIDGEGGFGWTEGPDGKVNATISGKKAYRIQGRLADSPGTYLGRMEAGGAGLRFVGNAEAAEETTGTEK
jgi:hypothetical protein